MERGSARRPMSGHTKGPGSGGINRASSASRTANGFDVQSISHPRADRRPRRTGHDSGTGMMVGARPVPARTGRAMTPEAPMTTTTQAPPAHHPVVSALAKRRSEDFQLRVADKITAFAGSMPFLYLHAVVRRRLTTT